MKRTKLNLDRLNERLAPAVGILDINMAGTGTGDSFSTLLNSSDPARDSSSTMTPDGRYVVFLSNSATIDPTGGIQDIGGFSNRGNVYLRDRQTGTTELISATSIGTPNGGSSAASGSNGAVITPDGRYIAFLAPKESTLHQNETIDPLATYPVFPEREAVNLQAFVRDRQTGTTQLVSVSSGRHGGSGNLDSIGISNDGRYVVYSTPEGNYGSNDTNGVSDIYVYDRTTGVTKLVSHNLAGNDAGNGESIRPVISANGKTILFRSIATNLTNLADTNNQTDLFAYDVATGKISLVTVRADGTAAGNAGGSFDGYVQYRTDDSGTKILFNSRSTDLRTDSGYDFFSPRLFVRDLTAGTTTLVARTPDGLPADVDVNASLSRDGRYVALRSNVSLTGTPDSVSGVVYIADMQTGTYTLVSHDANGKSVDGYNPTISADGRYVAYFSGGTGIVSGVSTPTGANSSVYVYDRLADRSVAVTTNAAGTQTVDTSFGPLYALSQNGRTIIVSTDIDGAGFGLVDNNQDNGTPNNNNLYVNTVPVLSPLVAQPTITLAPGQANPTNASVTFKVTFNGQVTGFTASDISFAGSSVGGTPVATVTGGNRFFTVTVTGMTGEGNLVVSIPAGAAIAPDGSASLASPTPAQVRFDAIAPTIAIAPIVGQANPTNGNITFKVTFSEPITGFTRNDLDFSGSTVSMGTPTIAGSGANYTVTLPAGSDGQTGIVSLKIPAGTVTDLAGNPSKASSVVTVAFDSDAPEVELGEVQVDYATGTVTLPVTFSEPVTGFSAAGISLAGSTVSGSPVATVTGSGTDYVIKVTGVQGSGNLSLTIVGEAARDLAGNLSEASSTMTFSLSGSGDDSSTTDDNTDSTPSDTTTDDNSSTSNSSNPQNSYNLGAKFSVIGSPGGVVTVLGPDGKETAKLTIFTGYTGDVRTASLGNYVVAATGVGVASQVRVVDPTTGNVVLEIKPFESQFLGGVYVTTGDLLGTGTPAIITSPDAGGGPRVQIRDGVTGEVKMDFFGIDDPNFRGGCRTAVADITGDGTPDLIVAAGLGGGPRVTVYDGAELRQGRRKVVADFFVFEQSLRNGVYVAAGDLTGRGAADLIVGGGPGGGPRLMALSGKDVAAGSETPTVVANFFAGDPNNRAGVRIAVKDLDGDNRADLLTVPGPGGGTLVTAYAGKDLKPNTTPPVLFSYEDPAAAGLGVFVG